MDNWIDVTSTDDQARGYEVQMDIEAVNSYRHRVKGLRGIGVWQPGKPKPPLFAGQDER